MKDLSLSQITSKTESRRPEKVGGRRGEEGRRSRGYSASGLALRSTFGPPSLSSGVQRGPMSALVGAGAPREEVSRERWLLAAFERNLRQDVRAAVGKASGVQCVQMSTLVGVTSCCGTRFEYSNGGFHLVLIFMGVDHAGIVRFSTSGTP
jgi:hypothetical protein